MLIEKTPGLLKIAYAVSKSNKDKIKKVAEYTTLFLEQIATQDEIEKQKSLRNL